MLYQSDSYTASPIDLLWKKKNSKEWEIEIYRLRLNSILNAAAVWKFLDIWESQEKLQKKYYKTYWTGQVRPRRNKI